MSSKAILALAVVFLIMVIVGLAGLLFIVLEGFRGVDAGTGFFQTVGEVLATGSARAGLGAILFVAIVSRLSYVRRKRSESRDRTIEDLNHRINRHPDYPDPIFKRGQLYSEKGDFANAFTDYDRVILLSPQHAQAYLGRAIAYAQIEDDESLRIDKAISDVSRALELGLDESQEGIAKTALQAFSTLLSSSNRDAPV
jgi:tetratricopeptide (TPR) repeat protein